MTKVHPAVKVRNQIIRREGWKLVEVFDTNEHEPDKDVVLVSYGGKRRVLRIGEHRPLNFFPAGFSGKYIIIPELYRVDREVPYEVEQLIPGRLLCEAIPKPTSKVPVEDKWLRLLTKGHWEFQAVAAGLDLLEQTWTRRGNLEEYFKAAEPLLGKHAKKARKVILGKSHQFFWTQMYPCKWKYADDNLILTKDNKLGLIDNVKVSNRHWGYDLGWIFWPRWFKLDTREYDKAREHWQWLLKMQKMTWQYAPKHEKTSRKQFNLRFQLVIFERLIGALYDVGAGIKHAKQHIGVGERRQKFVLFLNQLLQENLRKLG